MNRTLQKITIWKAKASQMKRPGWTNKESYTSPLENSHILLRLFSRGFFYEKKIIHFIKGKCGSFSFLCLLMILCLIGRLIYLMGFRSDYYYEKAEDLHERERDIKAARGEIVDAKGKVLAANKTVCTISVIHSQIKEPEKVIALLTEKLGISEQTVRKKVEKISSIERIRTNVEKETGDEIRNAGFAGIKVDEDYRRYYPMGTLCVEGAWVYRRG